jgi:hypothetical protein
VAGRPRPRRRHTRRHQAGPHRHQPGHLLPDHRFSPRFLPTRETGHRPGAPHEPNRCPRLAVTGQSAAHSTAHSTSSHPITLNYIALQLSDSSRHGLTIKRQRQDGSRKWQQPHCPQVPAIVQHQHPDLPE